MTGAAWPAALTGALPVVPSHLAHVREVWARLDELEARGQAPQPSDAARYTRAGSDAIVPVQGSLLNRGNLLGQYGGTSYSALATELYRAAVDPTVQRVILDVNSGGGMVDGLEQVDEAMAAVQRSGKPILASVSGMAASAAYWIAAQADEIAMTAGSQVGSIGVVAAHVDVSGALEQAGVRVSLLHSGARKVDGNSFQPLPDDVRGRLQAEVDMHRARFAAVVGAGRPWIGAAGALATEAALYHGHHAVSGKHEAIDAGLADRIASLQTVVADKSNRGAARARKILTHPAAVGQEQLAAHLAAKAPMSADAAIGTFVAARKAAGLPEASTEPDDAISGIRSMFGMGADAKHSDGAAAARELLGKPAAQPTRAAADASGLDAAVAKLTAGRPGNHMPEPVGSPQFERERADGERWARENAAKFGRMVR